MTRNFLLLEELNISDCKIKGKKVVIAALEQENYRVEHKKGGSSAHRRQTCTFIGNSQFPAYCYDDFKVRLKL